jgi:hypothetical protein
MNSIDQVTKFHFLKQEIVNYLISSGCEENVRDSEGKLPKDLQPSIGLKFKPGPGF